MPKHLVEAQAYNFFWESFHLAELIWESGLASLLIVGTLLMLNHCWIKSRKIDSSSLNVTPGIGASRVLLLSSSKLTYSLSVAQSLSLLGVIVLLVATVRASFALHGDLLVMAGASSLILGLLLSFSLSSLISLPLFSSTSSTSLARHTTGTPLISSLISWQSLSYLSWVSSKVRQFALCILDSVFKSCSLTHPCYYVTLPSISTGTGTQIESLTPSGLKYNTFPL